MEHNITFSEQNLLKDPPGLNELKKIAHIGNLSIKELINKRSQVYKKIQPDLDQMDEKAITDLIRENPRILIRPLLTDGSKLLLLGFKEIQYQQLING